MVGQWDRYAHWMHPRSKEAPTGYTANFAPRRSTIHAMHRTLIWRKLAPIPQLARSFAFPRRSLAFKDTAVYALRHSATRPLFHDVKWSSPLLELMAIASYQTGKRFLKRARLSHRRFGLERSLVGWVGLPDQGQPRVISLRLIGALGLGRVIFELDVG